MKRKQQAQMEDEPNEEHSYQVENKRRIQEAGSLPDRAAAVVLAREMMATFTKYASHPHFRYLPLDV